RGLPRLDASQCTQGEHAPGSGRDRAQRAGLALDAVRRTWGPAGQKRPYHEGRQIMRELVLVHGRSQQHKDPVNLKKAWLDALAEGLAKSGLTLPVAEESVRFPYYGDPLIGLVEGKSAEEAANVIVRGTVADADEEVFFRSVLEEVRHRAGVTDAEI